jgi:hypothetical protein
MHASITHALERGNGMFHSLSAIIVMAGDFHNAHSSILNGRQGGITRVCSIAIIPTFWLLACLLACSSRAAFALSRRHAEYSIWRHYFFLSPGLVQEQSDTLVPCSREDACSSTLRFAPVKLLFALALSLIAVACLALIVASCWSIGSFLRSSMLFERKARWRAAQCCLSSSTLA